MGINDGNDIKFYCNNEIVRVSIDRGKSWNMVGDCGDSLYDIVTSLLSALKIPYTEVDEDGNAEEEEGD